MRNTIRSVTMLALLLLTGTLAAAQQERSLGGVSYAAGDWLANGFGNHRAVVEVTGAADAVRARIRWRRHDAEFRAKAVLVCDYLSSVFAPSLMVASRWRCQLASPAKRASPAPVAGRSQAQSTRTHRRCFCMSAPFRKKEGRLRKRVFR